MFFVSSFNTAFFMIALKDVPDVIKENNEVTDFAVNLQAISFEIPH